jgi:hypothetical protein
MPAILQIGLSKDSSSGRSTLVHKTIEVGFWVQDEWGVGSLTKSCCIGSAYQENYASSQGFYALIS